MKELIFGETEIAHRLNVQSMEDLLNVIPFSDEYDNCNGRYINGRLEVIAITNDGRKKLEKEIKVEYADRRPNFLSEAEPIGVQISNLDATMLILTFSQDQQYYVGEVTEFCCLPSIDWDKVRKSAIEAIRLTKDREALAEIALRLGCVI